MSGIGCGIALVGDGERERGLGSALLDPKDVIDFRPFGSGDFERGATIGPEPDESNTSDMKLSIDEKIETFRIQRDYSPAEVGGGD